MTTNLLQDILTSPEENKNLEFKTWENSVSELGDGGKKKRSLLGYVVAIANVGGGKLIIGVSNEINPISKARTVVGTSVLRSPSKTIGNIHSQTRLRIEISEIIFKGKRVVIVDIPSRPIGQVVKFYGIPLMRSGEELIEMDDDYLRRILLEHFEDFSSETFDGIVENLDKKAIQKLKKLWSQKTNNLEILQYSDEKILNKLLLVRNGKITNAAALLLVKNDILSEKLPQCEIIFEWRSSSAKIDFDSKSTFREPFVLAFDKIWETIDSRNTRIPISDGFTEQDIWSFTEKTAREAVLNAFAHREYRGRSEPVFIRANPEKITFKSPGGFLPGVTPDNAISVEGKWRNRFLMEVLEKIGLVERSGLGLDRIYQKTISDGKGFPFFHRDFRSDVTLEVPAIVKDFKFIEYLKIVCQRHQLSVEQIIELESIRVGKKKTGAHLIHKDYFLDKGIIEPVGFGRGRKYVLARNYYEYKGNIAEYRRISGLDRSTKKTLILNELNRKNRGITFSEIASVFPDINSKDITNLLQELRLAKKALFDRTTKKWIKR